MIGKRETMHDDVDLLPLRLERLGEPVDVRLLLHIAWVEVGNAEFLPEFLDRGLGSFVLVSE